MQFDPGFRISVTDSLFVIIMAAATLLMWENNSLISWLLIAPTLQFFLFCNVFRIRRIPELIWAAVYITISLINFSLTGHPAYPVGIGLMIGFALIINELRHPSYHGVMWRSFNPNLETWFKKQCEPIK